MEDNSRIVENVLVTGATNGIGMEMAEQLVAQGKNVYLTGRNQEKLDAVVNDLNTRKVDGQTIESFCFDIGLLSDVQAVMPRICQIPLDTVIFNAGTMFPPIRPSTKDDLPHLEDTIKVNIIGHFLMARHLLVNPLKPIRFVCLSSIMAKAAVRWNRWPNVHSSFHRFFRRTLFLSDGWWSYFDSKLAAIVMAQWLEKKEDVSGVAIHPGVASTGMVESIPKIQRVLLRPLAQTLEPVAVCANRVIQEAVLCNNDFTNTWICKGPQPIPTSNLSDLQKDEFIKFLHEVTQPFT